MASLNNVVRTQNYKRLAAELESKRSRVSELEQQNASLQKELEANAGKTEAFEILAEAVKLQTQIINLSILSEPFESELPGTLHFDNKMDTKVLKLKSITITNGDNYELNGELETEEKIYDETGKEVCSIKSFKLGSGTKPSEESETYGDVIKYAGEFSTTYYESATLRTESGVCIKQPDSNPSFGELISNEAQFTVRSLNNGSTWFVQLSVSDDAFTFEPVPAKVEEA